MRRLLPLLAAGCLVGCVVGCGGLSGDAPATTTAAAPPPPSAASVLGPGGRALYQSAGWAVVVQGTKAVAAHFVGGRWSVDRSGRVTIEILGNRGPVAPTPQVAVELRAKQPLIESGLWVDGRELLEKGGGLGPDRGTIYGAPAKPLSRGTHLAVAFGRTAATGTAVAWTLTVR